MSSILNELYKYTHKYQQKLNDKVLKKFYFRESSDNSDDSSSNKNNIYSNNEKIPNSNFEIDQIKAETKKIKIEIPLSEIGNIDDILFKLGKYLITNITKKEIKNEKDEIINYKYESNIDTFQKRFNNSLLSLEQDINIYHTIDKNVRDSYLKTKIINNLYNLEFNSLEFFDATKILFTILFSTDIMGNTSTAKLSNFYDTGNGKNIRISISKNNILKIIFYEYGYIINNTTYHVHMYSNIYGIYKNIETIPDKFLGYVAEHWQGLYYNEPRRGSITASYYTGPYTNAKIDTSFINLDKNLKLNEGSMFIPSPNSSNSEYIIYKYKDNIISSHEYIKTLFDEVKFSSEILNMKNNLSNVNDIYLHIVHQRSGDGSSSLFNTKILLSDDEYDIHYSNNKTILDISKYINKHGIEKEGYKLNAIAALIYQRPCLNNGKLNNELKNILIPYDNENYIDYYKNSDITKYVPFSLQNILEDNSTMNIKKIDKVLGSNIINKNSILCIKYSVITDHDAFLFFKDGRLISPTFIDRYDNKYDIFISLNDIMSDSSINKIMKDLYLYNITTNMYNIDTDLFLVYDMDQYYPHDIIYNLKYLKDSNEYLLPTNKDIDLTKIILMIDESYIMCKECKHMFTIDKCDTKLIDDKLYYICPMCSHENDYVVLDDKYIVDDNGSFIYLDKDRYYITYDLHNKYSLYILLDGEYIKYTDEHKTYVGNYYIKYNIGYVIPPYYLSSDIRYRKIGTKCVRLSDIINIEVIKNNNIYTIQDMYNMVESKYNISDYANAVTYYEDNSIYSIYDKTKMNISDSNLYYMNNNNNYILKTEVDKYYHDLSHILKYNIIYKFTIPNSENLDSSKVRAYRIDGSYSNYFINKDNEFLAYMIPSQLIGSDEKIMGFLNGELVNGYTINNSLYSRLFDSNTILSFKNDPEKDTKYYSYNVDVDGDYYYDIKENRYIYDPNRDTSILKRATSHKYYKYSGDYYSMISFEEALSIVSSGEDVYWISDNIFYNKITTKEDVVNYNDMGYVLYKKESPYIEAEIYDKYDIVKEKIIWDDSNHKFIQNQNLDINDPNAKYLIKLDIGASFIHPSIWYKNLNQYRSMVYSIIPLYKKENNKYIKIMDYNEYKDDIPDTSELYYKLVSGGYIKCSEYIENTVSNREIESYATYIKLTEEYSESSEDDKQFISSTEYYAYITPYSRNISSVYLANMRNIVPYRNSSNIEHLGSGIFDINMDSPINIPNNFGNYLSMYYPPLSKKYMLFFINGKFANPYIKIITPQKFIISDSSFLLVDDNGINRIEEITKIDIYADIHMIHSLEEYSIFYDNENKYIDTIWNDYQDIITDYYKDKTTEYSDKINIISDNFNNTDTEIKDASLYEIFGKYILNIIDIDQEQSILGDEIREYFESLPDYLYDGRMKLELMQNKLKRKYIY